MADESMTDAQLFRFGFLAKLAELGMTPADAEAMCKRAGVGDVLSTAANFAFKQAPLLSIGAAAGVGALGGHTLAKLQERPADPTEVRSQELIAAYRAFAEQARQRRELATRMSARQPGRRSIP